MNTQELKQKSKEALWYDESGQSIPYNRTTKAERLMERHAYSILTKAERINKALIAFKEEISEKCQEAYEAFMEEKGADPANSKGNFLWYNFNRTIKIEVKVNNPITFDDLTIKAAKEKLDIFLEQNITAKNEFVKEMVLKAFETSRGRLDTKEVMKITRYETKVNDPLYSEAVELINQAIRRPSSKTYFRVWVKDASGEYQNVDLNLSSI